MANHVAVGENTSATSSLNIGALSGGPYDDGHTLVVVVACSTVSTAPTMPGGWTLVAASASGSSGSWVYARKGDGSTNSVAITLPGTGTYRAWLMAFAGTWSDQLFEDAVQPFASSVTSQPSGTLTAAGAAFGVAAAQLSGSSGGSGFSWTNGWSDIGAATPGGGSSHSFNVRDRVSTAGEAFASTVSWTFSRNVRLAAAIFSRRAPAAARVKKVNGLTADATITYNEGAALGNTYGHLLCVRRESTSPIATPSGWTLEGGGGQAGHNVWVYSKHGDATTNSVLLDLPDSSVTDAVLAAWPGILKDDFVASVDLSATSSGTSHASASVNTSEADMFAVAFGSYADTAGAITAIGSSYQTMFGWPTTSEMFFGDRVVPAASTAVGFTATHSGGTSRTGREVVVTLSTAPDETYDGPGQFYAWHGDALDDPAYLLGVGTV